MFLATTSNEEYWDTSQKNILIAGEWCRKYNKNYSVNIECLPYIWDDSEKIYQAQKYCDEIYEEILLKLTQTLNEYLGLNCTSKYYRILFGHWLIQFIHQVYDKYCILTAAKKHGATETWVIDEKQYFYPYNVHEYMNMINGSDIYHLQIFSQIANHVDINTKVIMNKVAFLPNDQSVSESIIHKLLKINLRMIKKN